MIDDLWYKNAIIYCLDVEKYVDSQRRRDRRFPGLTERLRLSRRSGDHLPVASAVLSLAQPRQRLRRGRLLRRASQARHAGRLRRVQQPGRSARHPGAGRPGGQPHFRTPSLVPVRAQGSAFSLSRLVRLVRHRTRGCRFKASFSRACKKRPGRATRRPGNTTFTASTIFSPTSTPPIQQVREEILRIMGFWLQLGVAGFRMDAVPFPHRAQGRRGGARKDYELLHDMRDFLQWRRRDAILLAEANVPPNETHGILRRATATGCR